MTDQEYEALLNLDDEDFLEHYGTKMHSGRYPWGSGDESYQHSGDFLSRIDELKASGLTEVDIAKTMGISTTKLRVQRRLASLEKRAEDVATATKLQSEGMNPTQIAKEMGYKNESSIRNLLNEGAKSKAMAAQETADYLKKQIAEKGVIDVGVGVERDLGIPRTKLDQALYILETEGYIDLKGSVPQATNPGKKTNLHVIGPEGTPKDAVYDYENISTITDYRIDGSNGKDIVRPAFQYPESIKSSRVSINYAEDGGLAKDGLIELRRNVDDLSLGESNYSQVRILVDGDKYIKGMAVYADDLPEGVDIRFNTNKTKGTSMDKVLKPIKDDPENPFGALLKEEGGQSTYIGEDGKEHLSKINKTREEGDWSEWSNKLPSQFLSKQSLPLIKQQLGLAEADKLAEFDEIMAYTNPTVKKALLEEFASGCDTAAVHLYAAALPGQKYHVILPVNSLGDTEVYANDYIPGTQLALIRYPHGGTFEIPICTVTNKNKEAGYMIGNVAEDAIGINSKVASILSGADFDGDTVMAIPINNKAKITNTKPLKDLEGFDPKTSYPFIEGMTLMKHDDVNNTQKEMGMISNLITDMTLQGATEPELARAVKHSMVVIDAGKHKLNYKQSEKDQGIAELKEKYQGTIDEDGRYHAGAATLLSRAKSDYSVPKRRGQEMIDPNTGKVSYKLAYDLYYTDPKTGKTKMRMQRSSKMAETEDATSLISSAKTAQELAYADYANHMKALANKARKEMVNTKENPYSSSARKTYQKEVDQLESMVRIAEKNAPRERKAQLIANSKIKSALQSNPSLSKQKKEKKKLAQQALNSARNSLGARKQYVTLTSRQWEAIQAGAISATRLSKILSNMKSAEIKKWALPRNNSSLSAAQIGKVKSMAASGYTTAEIAKALGKSTSTIANAIKGKE